jgi:tetratricopeptide (TPR) repeat protein
MSTTTSPQFISILTNALNHWQQVTEKLDDARIIEIDPERHNLHQAVVIGLELPQTWQLAAEVALQAFYLVERRGYWQEWLEVLNKALAQCPTTDYRLQGQLLNRIGELYRDNHQLEEAVAAHKRAEAIAQQHQDEWALAEVHFRLCNDFLVTRQYAEAEQFGLLALETLIMLGAEGAWLPNIYRALGTIARLRGDIPAALEQLARAAELGRKLNQPTSLARIIFESGIAYLDAGRYEEALAQFQEADELLASTASERDKVQVQINLGALYFRQQQWEMAEFAFQRAQASRYLRHSGNAHLQALVATNLSNVLLKQDRLAEAEDLLRQAWDVRLRAKDEVSLANTLGSLAEVLFKQGQSDEAISLYEQAITLLTKYPDDAFAQTRLLPQFRTQLQAIEKTARHAFK